MSEHQSFKEWLSSLEGLLEVRRQACPLCHLPIQNFPDCEDAQDFSEHLYKKHFLTDYEFEVNDE